MTSNKCGKKFNILNKFQLKFEESFGSIHSFIPKLKELNHSIEKQFMNYSVEYKSNQSILIK